VNYLLRLLLIGIFISSVEAQIPHENISQAVFAKTVENREPVDIIKDASDSLGKIYFFTNMRNLTGERITHRWSYNNKIMAQISFDIKGQRWRVWSSKNLWHTWLGEWTVDVLNQHSDVLISKTFYYRNKDE
jgi:hypothetical protein